MEERGDEANLDRALDPYFNRKRDRFDLPVCRRCIRRAPRSRRRGIARPRRARRRSAVARIRRTPARPGPRPRTYSRTSARSGPECVTQTYVARSCVGDVAQAAGERREPAGDVGGALARRVVVVASTRRCGPRWTRSARRRRCRRRRRRRPSSPPGAARPAPPAEETISTRVPPTYRSGLRIAGSTRGSPSSTSAPGPSARAMPRRSAASVCSVRCVGAWRSSTRASGLESRRRAARRPARRRARRPR